MKTPRDASDTWVFAYGSLMWHPGFPYAEARRARLTGYHRAFCIYSIHYRGSARRPGLVLGLDRGGTCEGLAFRLAPGAAPGTLAYLRRRELIYGVYRETLARVELTAASPTSSAAPMSSPAPASVLATVYFAERTHPAYSGRLPLATQAHLIRGARGDAGTNLDYLINTVGHLRDLGIRERRLERLLAVSGAFAAHGANGGMERARARAMAAAWAGKPVRAPKLTRDRRFAFRARLEG